MACGRDREDEDIGERNSGLEGARKAEGGREEAEIGHEPKFTVNKAIRNRLISPNAGLPNSITLDKGKM